MQIPPGRAFNALISANAALSDDERFVAVFNYTPATSLSIVDVEKRVFVAEIAIPGCSLAYAAGPRRFASLCADGALLLLSLDASGHEAGRQRSQPFFDPNADPVTEKAVRLGDTLALRLVRRTRASGRRVRPGAALRRALVAARHRRSQGRAGASGACSIWRCTGRPGASTRSCTRGEPTRTSKPARSSGCTTSRRGAACSGSSCAAPASRISAFRSASTWPWPFSRIPDWLVYYLPEFAVGAVAVTQDAQPLLVTGSNFSGSLAVYDALSGEFLRRVAPGNMTTLGIQTPFTGAEAAR